MRCGWWARWWHRRLRRADRACIIPLIREGDPQNRADALAIFLLAPGQDHWRCACAKAEASDALDTLLLAEESDES